MGNLNNTNNGLDNAKKELRISDVSKSFIYCLEKAMGYAYASATDGVGRKEAQEDFKKYRDEMYNEFQKVISAIEKSEIQKNELAIDALKLISKAHSEGWSRDIAKDALKEIENCH